MITIFNLLTHLLIIGGISALIWSEFYLIVKMSKEIKRVLRIIAAVVGTFIYIGLNGIGLSLTNLIICGIKVENPILFALFSVVIPLLVGAIIPWYFMKKFEKNNEVVVRIIILIIAFIITLLIDAYFTSYSLTQFTGYNKALLPNLFFIIGIAMYIILNYNEKMQTIIKQ